MPKHALFLALAASTLVMVSSSRVEGAPIISIGSYTASTAAPFLVPIVVSDAELLIGWSFGLAYDPADLQINDPATLDAFGRPVTEGEFFAAGAPFNLLVPGVIVLDSTTLQQTGVLFGVEGMYGGLEPAPSGSGVLAYVEFVTTANGTGESTIRVTAQSTAAAVPEPATALLAGALMVGFGLRRLSGRCQSGR